MDAGEEEVKWKWYKAFMLRELKESRMPNRNRNFRGKESLGGKMVDSH